MVKTKSQTVNSSEGEGPAHAQIAQIPQSPIPIDQKALDDPPSKDILPFHIQHIILNAGIDSSASDYVPGSTHPAHLQQLDPQLTDILTSTPSTIPFKSVVVADVDSNAPSNALRSAALHHMAKAGSNYIEIPHGPRPINEFDNPTCFPCFTPLFFRMAWEE
jgi:hypothetical protein